MVFRMFFSSLLILLVGVSCSGRGKSFFSQAHLDQCAMRDDQRDSFLGHVPSFPIALILDSEFDHFSEEKQQILAAASDWNQFGETALGTELFTITSAPVPADVRQVKFQPSQSSQSCVQDVIPSGVAYVVRVSDFGSWQALKKDPGSLGVSIMCEQSDSGTNRTAANEIFEEAVYLDPALINIAQLKSTALHELGHLIGLDHSCAKSLDEVSARYVSCDGLTADDKPYANAVMYPSLPETKFADGTLAARGSLTQNDKDRFSCLYSR